MKDVLLMLFFCVYALGERSNYSILFAAGSNRSIPNLGGKKPEKMERRAQVLFWFSLPGLFDLSHFRHLYLNTRLSWD